MNPVWRDTFKLDLDYASDSKNKDLNELKLVHRGVGGGGGGGVGGGGGGSAGDGGGGGLVLTKRQKPLGTDGSSGAGGGTKSAAVTYQPIPPSSPQHGDPASSPLAPPSLPRRRSSLGAAALTRRRPVDQGAGPLGSPPPKLSQRRPSQDIDSSAGLAMVRLRSEESESAIL